MEEPRENQRRTREETEKNRNRNRNRNRNNDPGAWTRKLSKVRFLLVLLVLVETCLSY